MTSLAITAGALPILAFSHIFTASAASLTTYTDVPTGAYYEEAAAALLRSGALDKNESRLRPSDTATRAEVMKLLVSVNGTLLINPSQESFDDVSKSQWYYRYIETAADKGWLKGDADCYTSNATRCMARPAGHVNRAEMATIMQRAFQLDRLSLAPIFSDNTNNQTWYYSPIQIAADHCILRGDGTTGNVRPSASMNRAEMVVMFYRAQQQQRYGQDCSNAIGNITSVETTASNRLSVEFNVDIDPTHIGQRGKYTLEDAGGTGIAVSATEVINARSVNLILAESLLDGTTYRLTVNSLRTENGALFTDARGFTSDHGEEARIDSATARSVNIVRIRFSNALNVSRALEEPRYAIERTDTSESIGIQDVTLLDDRTVDITLSSSMTSNVSYRANVTGMQLHDGQIFSDSAMFSYASAAHVVEVIAISSSKLRIVFDTDLNRSRAEEEVRYSVSNASNTISIKTASLLNDNRTVEVELLESLRTQGAYRVQVLNMLTSGQVQFNATSTIVFDAGAYNLEATLNGVQERPSVSTSASGTGTFVLSASGLAYNITVQNLSSALTASHFHMGVSGVNGPVLMAISFNGNHAQGTWEDISNSQRNALLDEEIYVNVHTTNYPDGEIRGQIISQ